MAEPARHRGAEGTERPRPRPLVESVAYSVEGACVATGISRSRMFDLLRDGTIKAKRMGSHRLIPRDELARFIDQLPDAA